MLGARGTQQLLNYAPELWQMLLGDGEIPRRLYEVSLLAENSLTTPDDG